MLFKKLADQLHVDGELILRGNKVVVPYTAVKRVLKTLHASYQGIEKTKLHARQTVYWPGYGSDINNTVQECHECMFYRPLNAPEPLIQEDQQTTRPFEMPTADLFSLGDKEYMVYTDRLSGFPLVAKYASSSSASTLVNDFCYLFCLMGVPNILRSDSGPQFRAELTQQFLHKWGVKWVPSSPGYPQSNGHAEASVKAVKHLLAKSGGKLKSPEFQEGLLEFRNTPHADGLSPAQVLFGRALRSRLPASWRLYKPSC